MNPSGSEPRLPADGAVPASIGIADPPGVHGSTAEQVGPPDDLPRVSGAFILCNTLALFGTYIALVTPIAVSLAIQVDRLAPDGRASLGVILGVGSLAAVVIGPLTGQLSDRTRSRFGRRAPWALGSLLVGIAGLAIMAAAPGMVVLGAGWVVAQMGLQTTLRSVNTIGADRLPASQRGRVGGLGGAATMVAPVVGAVIGGSLSGNPYLLFLVPAAVALVLVPVFLLVARDEDSRALTFDTPLTAWSIFASFGYAPRRYPDFSWNWAGRFLFFFGLSLSTTFTAFFYSSRLDIPVDDIGTVVATVGGAGVLGTAVGALGGGLLSDKVHRRKPFILGAAGVYALGAMTMFVAPALPVIVVGAFLCNLGIGAFSAVATALLFDVLPEKKTGAGRFSAIGQLATTIPQSDPSGLSFTIGNECTSTLPPTGGDDGSSGSGGGSGGGGGEPAGRLSLVSIRRPRRRRMCSRWLVTSANGLDASGRPQTGVPSGRAAQRTEQHRHPSHHAQRADHEDVSPAYCRCSTRCQHSW